MTITTLPRQFVTNTDGRKIGVILPISEFNIVENVLEKRLQEETQLLKQMEEVVKDSLFMEDLNETMNAFAVIDSEWWEQES